MNTIPPDDTVKSWDPPKLKQPLLQRAKEALEYEQNLARRTALLTLSEECICVLGQKPHSIYWLNDTPVAVIEGLQFKLGGPYLGVATCPHGAVPGEGRSWIAFRSLAELGKIAETWVFDLRE